MKYNIGDKLIDKDGDVGYVVIKWNDGDSCYQENDAAHPNPTIIGNFNEEKEKKS